jgi:hypothetical protein
MDPHRLRDLLESRPLWSERRDESGLDEADAQELRAAAAANPEFAAEVERVRVWDASLARAFADVPIPTGLADRLLAAAKAEAVAAAVTPASLTSHSSARHMPRRNLMAGALVAAATIALAIFGGNYLWFSTPSAEAIVAEAQDLWFSRDDARWQVSATAAALEQYPPTSRVKAAPNGWQPMSTSLDRRAVAYRLALGKPVQGMLLVMRAARAVEGLPTRPPQVPQSSTQGICLGVWQEGELVYALIIQGNQQDYGRLLQSSPILS